MIVNTKQINFTVIDARTVDITGNTASIKEHKFDNNIVSIEFLDKIITLQETISFSGITYKINIIKKIQILDYPKYQLLTAEPNRSNLMILPMLGGTQELFAYSLLVNCFVNYKGYKGKIILVYKNITDKLKLAFQTFRNFIKKIEFTQKHTMFIFSVPKKHEDNYEKCVEGKYSEFNPEYKEQILTFHSSDISSSLGHILFKSKDRRLELEKELNIELNTDAELFSILNIELETFNPNYYGIQSKTR